MQPAAAALAQLPQDFLLNDCVIVRCSMVYEECLALIMGYYPLLSLGGLIAFYQVAQDPVVDSAGACGLTRALRETLDRDPTAEELDLPNLYSKCVGTPTLGGGDQLADAGDLRVYRKRW
jgi:hypothetical protein